MTSSFAGRRPSSLLVGACVAATALTGLTTVTAADAGAAAPARRILDTGWSTATDFAAGSSRGVVARGDSLRLGGRTLRTRFRDLDGTRVAAEKGHWTSPWVTTRFGATEAIPSWRAATPRGSFVVVRARARDASGARGSWDTVARWAGGDQTILRSSGQSQADDLTSLATDTLRATGAKDGRATGWQLRVTLVKDVAARRAPTLRSVSLVASRVPAGPNARVSRPAAAGLGTDLQVPAFSQMVHRGEYPQWGGGGEVWCSPTSISMVMAYWDRLPPARRYRWVDKSFADPVVDHGARSTYDYSYEGAGNWAFTTAYAGTRLGQAHVTRMHSLRAVQRHVAAGVPVVISVAFGSGQLSGAPISSTAGHLLVVRGFTADGDVIVNDPAASSNAGVRRVYDRAQLEAAWQRRSGGLAYVAAPSRVSLP